ncbi:phenolic acid decarboxylase [Glycomyces sp. L485]|uniref:phenolic acid decarboxylase n=1 Tax=Glycomyces sp. L485 TaxID=2909235 RepID=UPI001F4ADCAE|nr:phenolic acid decarboxylase [Glycomyces sp. L485]MCH7229319.1 phenolic acid decarboxylase [Glycomyces sp. L485]
MDGLAFAGKSYEIKVDNGMVFHHTYSADGRTLHYETVAGPMEGASEDVRLRAAEVASGIYLVGWNEISGLTVALAMNLNDNTVHTIRTHEAEGERHSELLSGTITESG